MTDDATQKRMTALESSTEDGPLDGFLVLDVSRMLPGAILARLLVDLGARVVKVEDPAGGDLLRHAPPLAGGVGAGFCALLRGCESVALDLRVERDSAAFRGLARHADVVVESFRPGAMEEWGVGSDRLRADNPRLVTCSLSGFGGAPGRPRQPAHDLNFAGLSGLAARLGGTLPGVLLADVAGGILAGTAIVAALLRRQRSGRGAHVDQPLAAAPLPFLTWAWADAALGGLSAGEILISGRCPAYRTYECADGAPVAVAAIEPKFWSELVRLLEVPHLAGAGLDPGPAGAAAAAEVAARFRSRPRAEWLAAASARELPVTPVHDLAAARREPLYVGSGWLERLPLPGGEAITIPGPFIPSLGRTPAAPAPRLGEHTAAVLGEFGIAR